MPAAHWDGTDLILEVLVSPRASHDAIGEIADDRLKIRLAAAPVDGEANHRLVALLADTLDVPRRQVTIEHGQQGRRKRIRIAKPRELSDFLNILPR